MLQNRPGALPTTAEGWHSTTRINGKDWRTSSIMLPETAGRIIGNSGEEYIGPPYDKNKMIVGKLDIFGEKNEVDLATTDEVHIWNGENAR